MLYIHTHFYIFAVAEPSHTPTATCNCFQTAALTSIISSLITALSILSIFFAVFGIYSVKKCHSNKTGNGPHLAENEDVVYEAVDENLHDGIAMRIKHNDAYQANDVTVSMEENEAYGTDPPQDSTEDS